MKTLINKYLRSSEKYTKIDMVYFASGNFWLFLSRVIGIGSGIILTLGFANLISPETFGTYKYILALASTIGAFSLTGLGTATTRTIAKGNHNIINNIFRLNILWSIPGSIIAITASLYYLYMGNEILSLALFIISITTPLLNSFFINKAILVGKKDFKTLAKYNVPGNLITVISMLFVLFITDNIILIIASYFISNLISGGLVYYLCIKKYPKDQNITDIQTDKDTKETLNYGKHLSLIGSFVQLTSQIDQLLLWQFVGPAQIAIYSFAQAPIRETKSIVDNILAVVFPKFAQKTKKQIEETLSLRLIQVTILSALMALVYVLTIPYLFMFIFPQYLSAIFPSQLLAIVILLQPKGIIETIIIAQGDVRKKYLTTIIPQISRIILFIILIPIYGIIGAISAIVISEIIATISLIIIYKKLK